jgi:hypothetical protein
MIHSGVDLFAEIMDAAASGRRSTLYRWMADNHGRFADVVAAAGRPNRTELAWELGNMGLRDRAGNPPSPANARLTWLWVRKAHAKAQGQPVKQIDREATPPPSTTQ